MSDIVLSDRNGEAMVSSREVAAKFGKRHKDVLKGVDEKLSSVDSTFSRRNFAPSTYVDERGKTQPEILMTKDGFMFAVMGFTGKEADVWKIKFIETFNSLVSTVELLNTQVKDLQFELDTRDVMIQQLLTTKSKKARKPATHLVPEFHQQTLPGFPNDPVLVRKPLAEIGEPQLSVQQASHLKKTITGLQEKLEKTLKRIGL